MCEKTHCRTAAATWNKYQWSSHYSAVFCRETLDCCIHLDATWHKPSIQTPSQTKHDPPMAGQCLRNVTEGLRCPSGFRTRSDWVTWDVPWLMSFTSPVSGFNVEPAGCLRTDSCHAFIYTDVICSHYTSCFSWRWSETCPSWLTR